MRQWLTHFLLTGCAALLGNWVGAQLRTLITGEQTQSIHFKYKDEKGTTFKSMPISTKLYPAWLVALLGQPRWLFALGAGIVTGFAVPDELEARLLRLILKATIPARKQPITLQE